MNKLFSKKLYLSSLSLLLAFSLGACAQKTPNISSSKQNYSHHNKTSLNSSKDSKISVTGEGKIEIAPDMAVVRIGTISQKEHAQEAQDRVNDIVNHVLKSLTDMGVSKKHIQTSSMTLNLVYKHNDNFASAQIIAYRANNTIEVKVVHMDRIGQIISQAVKDGANNIQGISYQLQDDTDAKTQAIGKAVKQAQQKAKAVADYMGLKLSSVADVQVGSTNARWFTPRKAVANTLSSSYKSNSTPTEPGQIKITASVSITYNLSK